jgi:hypothetical protein
MSIDLGSLTIGTVIGAICAILGLLLVPERAARSFCRSLMHRSNGRSILEDGYWYSVFYRKNKEGQLRRHVHILHFSRLLNFYHAVVVQGEYHHFQLFGKLSKDQYVTGSWSNDDRRRKYRGAFQFKIHNNGVTITGKWLGWNQAEAVNAGLWAMTRLTPNEVIDLSIDGNSAKNVRILAIELASASRRLEEVILSEKNTDRSLAWQEV